MSYPGYSAFFRAVRNVDYELVEYGQILRTCYVPLQALQLADASECIGVAHEGVADQMLTRVARENLQLEAYRRSASLRRTMIKRYGQARDWAYRDCQPK